VIVGVLPHFLSLYSAIVETQRPVTLDPKAAGEGHFAADRISFTYRRVLKQMGLSQA
jgi:hypothetical protein